MTNKEVFSEIGRRIKRYRQQRGITQVELADKLNISLSYLSKIEAENCEKSFSLDVLIDIAATLDVPIQDFLIDL